MAKGEGGGGHYAERMRSKPKEFYPDDDEVLREIVVKPKVKAKPARKKVMVKPKVKPSRVKVESDPGYVSETYTPSSVVTTTKPRSPARSISDFVESLRSGGKRLTLPASSAPSLSYAAVREPVSYPSFGGPTPSFERNVPASATAATRESNLRRLTDIVKRKRLKVGRSGATGPVPY